MNVTRDVILDLLPVYSAEEASDDTRKLVEDWLAQDPELARLAGEGREVSLLDGVEVPNKADAEMKTLYQTQRFIRLRAWFFGLAIFCTAMPFAFHGSSSSREIRWVWAEMPAVAGALLLLAGGLWVAYGWLGRRLHAAGL